MPPLPKLRFGFIDSSHPFDLTIHEFCLIDRKLKVGGILVFRDMWMPSLKKLLRKVLANRSYELVENFDAAEAASPCTMKQAIKRGMLRALHVVPGKKRIFREELLCLRQSRNAESSYFTQNRGGRT